MTARNVGVKSAARLSRRLRLLVKKRTLTCKEVTAVISASFEREPSVIKNILPRLHLLVCGACARFLRQLQLLRHALRLRAASAREFFEFEALLSDAARERIRRALDAETRRLTD